MRRLDSVRESVPHGCIGGDTSAGCFEQNSSRVAQPSIVKVARLQSKKPF